MRINKLELFGFKSFPDRTGFEFGSGISCVVGPNGSGKSNVVDALRWVIGEQSARSLRGKEMSDVIFAGSAVRSPVGFAEVTLTLGVGQGEPFPGDFARFEELEVGRRLYRDGTSEYLINKVKARRRDIVDLFLDTGVGANLYSFIAQGQVDRIVSQSPNERRSLIDEAAGISRYKIRREEALVRLTATATQLDRAADVAEEMERRLKTLRRQVVRAGRFRRLRAKIRQREIVLGVVKYAALSDDRRAYRNRLRGLKDTVGGLERSIERIGADLQTRDDEIEAVRGAVSTWRDQAAELEAVRREQEGAASLHRARHEELTAEAARARTRGETAAARLAGALEERASLRDDATRLHAELEAMQLEELATAHGEANVAVEKARSALDERTAAATEVAAQRRALDAALLRLAEPELTPLAEPPDVEGPTVALQEASAAADQASAEVKSLAERLEVERQRIRAERQTNDQAMKAHRLAERAWEDDRRSASSAQRRALEETRTALRRAEEGAKQKAVEARRARLQRLEKWASTCRQQLGQQTQVAKRTAGDARSRLEAERRSEVEGLKRRETTDVATALASVSTADLEAAESAVVGATSTVETARVDVETARTAMAALRSRVAALEAEWAVLEEQRSASIPATWGDKQLFDETAGPSDGRRIARPELLGLPVLEANALTVERGKGVWAGVSDQWTVVDDLPAAIRHLQTVGPPVASRDGAIRVDADGVVELGWERESRWSTVRELLAAARTEEEQSSGSVEKQQVVLQAATAALVDARGAVEVARKVLEEQRQVAVADARDALRVEEAASRERLAGRGETIDAELAAALQRIDDLRSALAEEEARCRGLASAVVETPTPWASVARGALVAAYPARLRARPTPLEQAPVDEQAATTMERQLSACRTQEAQARKAIERCREAVFAAERRRDAIEAEAESRRSAAARRAMERTTVQAQLDAVVDVTGVEEAREALGAAREVADAARRALADTQERRSEVREAVAVVQAKIEALAATELQVVEDRELAEMECSQAESAAEEALEASLTAMAAADEVAGRRSDVQERLTAERERLSRLLGEATEVRTKLEKNRAELLQSDQERQEVAAKVTQHQLDIEAIRKRIGERYQVSLPGLLDRLGMRKELVLTSDPAVKDEVTIGDVVLEAVGDLTLTSSMLDDEDRIVDMVSDLEELRTAIQKLGEVNLAAEDEYRELDERFSELDRQRADLEASVKSIRAAIAKMNKTCRERFRDAYDRVNEAFQVAYPQLVGGGDARLALTDEEDLLETGVDIFVRPPGKRLQNLTLLSGGEKAMTAIALLLAIFKVRPSPFCVLDEVDAPLDEANGSRFNAMIREMSSMSQFIVITHNRTTMECADVLYGVTMAAPGVSALVSVALDRA